MWWLLPVLILPFVELWTLLELGATVGVGVTLVWCIAAMFAGLALVRYARRRIVTRLQRGELDRQGPRAVFEDGLLLASGALIAFPGIASDAVGVLLMLPLVRRGLTSWLSGRAVRRGPRGAAPRDVRPQRARGASDVEIYPPGAIRPPARTRPVVIDID